MNHPPNLVSYPHPNVWSEVMAFPHPLLPIWGRRGKKSREEDQLSRVAPLLRGIFGLSRQTVGTLDCPNFGSQPWSQSVFFFF